MNGGRYVDIIIFARERVYFLLLNGNIIMSTIIYNNIKTIIMSETFISYTWIYENFSDPITIITTDRKKR